MKFRQTASDFDYFLKQDGLEASILKLQGSINAQASSTVFEA